MVCSLYPVFRAIALYDFSMSTGNSYSSLVTAITYLISMHNLSVEYRLCYQSAPIRLSSSYRKMLQTFRLCISKSIRLSQAHCHTLCSFLSFRHRLADLRISYNAFTYSFPSARPLFYNVAVSNSFRQSISVCGSSFGVHLLFHEQHPPHSSSIIVMSYPLRYHSPHLQVSQVCFTIPILFSLVSLCKTCDILCYISTPSLTPFRSACPYQSGTMLEFRQAMETYRLYHTFRLRLCLDDCRLRPHHNICTRRTVSLIHSFPLCSSLHMQSISQFSQPLCLLLHSSNAISNTKCNGNFYVCGSVFGSITLGVIPSTCG